MNQMGILMCGISVWGNFYREGESSDHPIHSSKKLVTAADLEPSGTPGLLYCTVQYVLKPLTLPYIFLTRASFMSPADCHSAIPRQIFSTTATQKPSTLARETSFMTLTQQATVSSINEPKISIIRVKCSSSESPILRQGLAELFKLYFEELLHLGCDLGFQSFQNEWVDLPGDYFDNEPMLYDGADFLTYHFKTILTLLYRLIRFQETRWFVCGCLCRYRSSNRNFTNHRLCCRASKLPNVWGN